MHVIITDSKHARVRSFQLGAFQLVSLCVGMLVLMISTLIAWWPAGDKASTAGQTPQATTIQKLLGSHAPNSGDGSGDAGLSSQAVLAQQNIDALAKRLGVMQARMIQLTALSERLAELAGLPEGALHETSEGEGGMLIEPESLSTEELSSALDELTQHTDEQLAWLSVIEDQLNHQEWAEALTPGRLPVDGLRISSRFGRRIDPFTGKRAMHAGLDFAGRIGTEVKATAGGVVVFAGRNGGHGRMVEIDHGNKVVTRYAHLKAYKVSKGDVVLPEQVIGLLGNSGRSTGPHLHFEVWVAGRARNPDKYLRDYAKLARAP